VGATPGIPSGFQLLDDMTGGFKGGQVIIIAARPAVGKSTLAVDFGRAAVFLAGKTVLMFSLEMGAKEVVSRIISAEAGVKTQDLKKGTLTELDWMQVEEAKKRFQTGTFLIDADPKMSVARIKSVANRQKLKPEGLDMVIIDYLQLMESSGNIGRNSSREQVVSEMSRGLKLLAKDLDVPVIVLSQLNRKSEERQDTRPLVSDLRESGSLEQDADIVFLIHRPEVSDPNNRPGEADLIIGKHRGGPTGKIPLTSMLEYSKFFPGEGRIPREMELSGDSEGGYGTTVDEIPW
jgi:replicative DNA helicase